MNLSLSQHEQALIKQRAKEKELSASRYVADLVADDARRSREALMREGYRVLAQQAAQDAELSLQIAQEAWPQMKATDEQRAA